MISFFKSLIHTKGQSKKRTKPVTAFHLFQELKCLHEHQSSYVRTVGGGFMGRTYILEKDNWKIDVNRSYSKEYKLEISFKTNGETYTTVCLMHSRDTYLHFLEEGEWKERFYLFYQTVPLILQEAKMEELTLLESKENYEISLKNEKLKTITKPQLINVLRNLYAMKKEKVYKKDFSYEGYTLFHPDFTIEIVDWGSIFGESNDYQLDITCRIAEKKDVSIVHSHTNNKKLEWRYDGAWNEYFLSLVAEYEKEIHEYWENNENEYRKSLS